VGRPLWDRIIEAGVPADPVERAAAFLALQASSVLGKPVSPLEGEWKTSGYGEVSPSGRRRGFRERLLPAPLADRVEKAAEVMASLHPTILHDDVRRHRIQPPEDGVMVLLIDPPYQGTTGYGSAQLSRAEVLEIARFHAAEGAVVGVCEGAPLTELEGWHAAPLVSNGDLRSAQKQTNWMTVYLPREAGSCGDVRMSRRPQ